MYYYTTQCANFSDEELKRILKMINDKDYIMLEGYNSDEKEKRYFENTDIIYSRYIEFDRSYLYLFLDESSYTQTFFESPSALKLYEGYIHTNSLQYLAPFGQSYINQKINKVRFHERNLLHHLRFENGWGGIFCDNLF